MANKTEPNQGSSGEQERGTPRVSRKVIGKTSAAYERKAGAEGGEEKKPEGEGEQAAGDQGAQAASQPAPDATGAAAGAAGSAEAAPDQARSEPGRAATRREPGARREARTTSEQTPAAPAGEPVAAAPRAEKAAPAPEPAAAQPPVPRPDPAAEFEALLRPTDIQRWDPGTPAAPPAKAPPGDSRSFRRRGENGEEFVLIYRSGSFLIRRAGRVGVMGTWTVTEYPNIGSAAHAYAQQCSDLVHTGFRDLR